MKSFSDRELKDLNLSHEQSIINGLNMLDVSPVNQSTPTLLFGTNSLEPILRSSINEHMEEETMHSPTFAGQRLAKPQPCHQKKYVCTKVEILLDGGERALERLRERLRQRDIHVLSVNALP